MKRRVIAPLALLGFIALVVVTVWFVRKYPVPVLQPMGRIGTQERKLMLFTGLLSIAVIIPVFTLLTVFSLRYREGNKKTKYTPELDGSRTAETIWWAIPTFIMIIISLVTWHSSYALDPYKPLTSSNQTVHVQVVALDWKWLFIYPDYGVASVNEAAIPVDTPVDFSITSDTVMNSFWVPSLGGQMYAMTGMSTQLHLDATKPGDYNGSTANISGKGFAGMRFVVKARPTTDFQQWVRSAQHSASLLDNATYAKLAQPSEGNKPAYFRLKDSGLYDTIRMKYMMPTPTENTKTQEQHQ